MTKCYNFFKLFFVVFFFSKKSHDTAVGPHQIHYELIKHLPKPSKERHAHILTLSGKVEISHLPGHRLQLSLSLNNERVTKILRIIDQ
jgi:hypothetical protein